jgi:hypothetical protein
VDLIKFPLAEKAAATADDAQLAAANSHQFLGLEIPISGKRHLWPK